MENSNPYASMIASLALADAAAREAHAEQMILIAEAIEQLERLRRSLHAKAEESASEKVRN